MRLVRGAVSSTTKVYTTVPYTIQSRSERL